MSTVYYPTMLVSDRLLNCTASIEAFDRDRHPAKAKLAERLERCAALAGAPFTQLVGDVETWTAVVVGERNGVAHHLQKRRLSEQSDVFYIWRALYLLFVMCLLRLAEAPEDVFERIGGSPAYSWLQRRLREVVR
jgi:hypothetical protein